MPGRKDKKSRSKEGAVGGGRKGGGGGGLASMMGFGVDPGGKFLVLHLVPSSHCDDYFHGNCCLSG